MKKQHPCLPVLKSGFSLIELLIIVAIILIMSAIAIPNLLRSRITANESSAVGSLRRLNTAQVTHSSAHPNLGFACDLATLQADDLIDPVLAGGNKSGYIFTILNCKKKKGIIVAYTWVASPSTPGTTGSRFFCSDETGVIKVSTLGVTDCVQKGLVL